MNNIVTAVYNIVVVAIFAVLAYKMSNVWVLCFSVLLVKFFDYDVESRGNDGKEEDKEDDCK